MNSEKKGNKKGGLRSFFTRRQFRYGWYATLLTVLFIAVVVVVNVIAGAVEDKWALKIDASATGVTNFSDKTYETIDALDQDVHVYMLFQGKTSSELRVNLEEILNKFRARNNHITVDVIDPVTEPNRVNKYTDGTTTLSEGSMIVTNADETRVKVIKSSELYSYTVNQSTYQYEITSFNGEAKLTTALMYVSSTDTPKVYFLTGHDEYASSYCTVLKGQLENENYEVGDLTLGSGTTLNPGDTVIVLAAKTDLTDGEYTELRDWLEAGGRLLYANDVSNVDMEKMPNMKSLLSYYALAFETGMVVEDENAASNWISSPMYIIPGLDAEHDITAALADSGRLILPAAGSIADPAMPLSGYSYTKLLTSSAKSYKKDITSENSVLTREATDEEGPFTLAMSVWRQNDVNDPSKDTRIVLINDLYTIMDTNYLYSSNNLDFTMNVMDWLVNREVSVYVRSKAIANTALTIPDAGTFYTLAAVVVIVIPAIVLIAGIWVWIRRRRL